ncbi:four helix bundle protein [Candidatus Roizmanbacteria bacterium CG10_big_fil_rev_8_21_14_0_10_39_6]|uniref:Four helix bundle protein n=1 Tax=Candidatus Roizmanbacteria bacterium CG10_big_fil_rev_8_21_14_0_10_39_6 TaxID=1974853 RepID=A0A2M8KTC7_9BACT|nr:MAG: four helix bundle protein [Candidatus Roizmanbacteria bacterium CG10_big_fil_rev_8_21_14_0_10_39_6]
MYKSERLVVWQESLVLMRLAYALCSKLPKQEYDNLTDQLRRSVTSINLDIAEGSGSENDKDFCLYWYIARKSLYEVVAILKIVEAMYGIEGQEIKLQTEKVGKILSGLIRKIKS